MQHITNHETFADHCFNNAIRCFGQWFAHEESDPPLALSYWTRGHGLCRSVAEVRGSDPKDVAIHAICRAAFQ